MFVSALLAASAGFGQAPTPRIIKFSGYEWQVKGSQGKVGPGPNFFDPSSDSVFVDAKGHLHLKVRKTDKGWTCSEVVLSKSLGYGTYTFTLVSPPSALDDNLILGLFVYEDDTKEIDIEWAKWGDSSAPNAQFVVQPYDRAGNMRRFSLPPDAKGTVSSFNWQKDSISFNAKAGSFSESWVYKGKDIPTPNKERAIINLWLMKGEKPKVEKEFEVVVKSFSFKK